MNWNQLLGGLFLLFFNLSLGAQSQVSGKLTDLQTKEPLIQATVSIEGLNTGVVTDLEGQYKINLQEGTHNLVFRFVGYGPIKKSITVDGKTPLVLDVALEAELISDVVVVTDGKYEKRLEESTVSIDVISAAMIQRNNVRSLEDVVSKTSGVQIMDGQVSIRGGAGYAYGIGSRVSFLVDGQLLLSAELSDVKWNFVPIENAEQIEIIKGSASVLYGSGALNGVINVRTAYATEKPYTSFTPYVGIYQQPKVDSMRWYDPKTTMAAQPMFMGAFFAHREKLSKNFDLVIGGNFHIENGYIKGIDERRFRFNYNTRYVHPGTDGRLFYGVNGTIMYHEQGTYYLALDMRNNAFRNIVESGRDRYLSKTIDPFLTYYDNWGNRHDFRGRWFLISKQRSESPSVGSLFSGEYQYQRDFSGWILTAGTSAQHFRANSILFDDNVQQTPDDDGRELFFGSSYAAYAQVEKKFFNRLSFVAGLRWEAFLIDTIFTPMKYPLPRFGLNYQASKFDFVRASFGSGFRFPSLGERFINEPIPVPGMSIGTFPNPDIQPERGWSSELAYRHIFRTNQFKCYLDAAVFWMEYKNMVEFVLGLYPEGLGFKSVNVSQARIAGWEISAQSEGNIGKLPLRIWGGYTYSYPGNMQSDTTQKQLDVYLRNMFRMFAQGLNRDSVSDIRRILNYRSMHNVRFDVETEWKGFTMGASANYNSFIHKIDLVFALGLVSPGITNFRKIHDKGNLVFDWRFGYRFNENRHLNFIVNNALNTEYAVRPARMGAPRSFTLKYTHVF